MNTKTLCIIKPEAVKKNLTGDIIKMIIEDEFKIIGMKMTRLNREKASVFYSVHKERSFFNELLDYMTSGPIILIALSKENAVENLRALIGSTDPATAAEGTIRKKYGENKSFNAVHGSDSDENAAIELSIMFERCDLMDCCGS